MRVLVLTSLIPLACGRVESELPGIEQVDVGAASTTSRETQGGGESSDAGPSAEEQEHVSHGPRQEGGARVECPPEVPEPVAACVGTGRCTYGDGARADCRATFSCEGNAWVARTTQCGDPPAGYCPGQPAAGDPCSPMNYDGSVPLQGSGAECEYPGGVLCYCASCELLGTSCNEGAGSRWDCRPPPTTEGCPQTIPNVGAPCERQGVYCEYGDACDPSGGGRFCRNQVWEVSNPECVE